MISLELETEPVAVDVGFEIDRMIVHLADGRSLSIPLGWYPRLAHGTPAERAEWRFLGDGDAIEWTKLDEHVSVAGLVAGRRSGESAKSLQAWLANIRVV